MWCAGIPNLFPIFKTFMSDKFVGWKYGHNITNDSNLSFYRESIETKPWFTCDKCLVFWIFVKPTDKVYSMLYLGICVIAQAWEFSCFFVSHIWQFHSFSACFEGIWQFSCFFTEIHSHAWLLHFVIYTKVTIKWLFWTIYSALND